MTKLAQKNVNVNAELLEGLRLSAKNIQAAATTNDKFVHQLATADELDLISPRVPRGQRESKSNGFPLVERGHQRVAGRSLLCWPPSPPRQTTRRLRRGTTNITHSVFKTLRVRPPRGGGEEEESTKGRGRKRQTSGAGGAGRADALPVFQTDAHTRRPIEGSLDKRGRHSRRGKNQPR